MGNNLTNDSSSGCDFSFLSSKDLRKSSLQTKPQPFERQKTKAFTVICHSNSNLSTKTDLAVEKKEKSSEGPTPMTKSGLLKRAKTIDLNIKDIPERLEKRSISEKDFRIVKVLGDGRYGRVCKVKKEDQKEVYVMKVICKKKFLCRNSCSEVSMIEKEILEKADHPFIPKFSYFFESERKSFLIIEYIHGTKLNKILQQLTRFSEEYTRFYAAEVLLTLEYLHENLGVIYEGLKPENIVLDNEGHIKIVDFELARKLDGANNQFFDVHLIDSPPPEILQGTKPDKMIDFWEFGCFIYELLTGKKPFQQGAEEDPEQIEKNILEYKLEAPQYISKTASDFITRLLDPKVENRLGYNGIDEIKKHPFFSQTNWEKIYSKSVYPPINPAQLKLESKQQIDLDSLSEVDDEDLGDLCSSSKKEGSLDFIPDPMAEKNGHIRIFREKHLQKGSPGDILEAGRSH